MLFSGNYFFEPDALTYNSKSQNEERNSLDDVNGTVDACNRC